MSSDRKTLVSDENGASVRMQVQDGRTIFSGRILPIISDPYFISSAPSSHILHITPHCSPHNYEPSTPPLHTLHTIFTRSSHHLYTPIHTTLHTPSHLLYSTPLHPILHIFHTVSSPTSTNSPPPPSPHNHKTILYTFTQPSALSPLFLCTIFIGMKSIQPRE